MPSEKTIGIGSLGQTFRRRMMISWPMAPERTRTKSQLPLLVRKASSLPRPMLPASLAQNVPGIAPSMSRVQLVPVDAPLSMRAMSLPSLVLSSMLASDAELGSFIIII